MIIKQLTVKKKHCYSKKNKKQENIIRRKREWRIYASRREKFVHKYTLSPTFFFRGRKKNLRNQAETFVYQNVNTSKFKTKIFFYNNSYKT
jgi:hypothetical protein